MTSAEGLQAPDLPFPVFQISQKTKRYLLYDVETITWLRRIHNFLGVLIGSLPQSPQQNVFLGLPLELQPEEARLLVEKGLAFIVDDLQNHESNLRSPPAQLAEYKINVRKEGLAAAKAVEKQKHQRTQEALQRLNIRQSTLDSAKNGDDPSNRKSEGEEAESLFDAPHKFDRLPASTDIVPYPSTPTTSYPPLSPPSPNASSPLPEVNSSSYALFKHLHHTGYFLSPGLRFGCQFLVYPGDPLRFHSHFLATSAGWDEELDLLDIVGGGRLGTGVKKGWLIGGVEEKDNGGERSNLAFPGDQNRTCRKDTHCAVRTFCIEWGGM